MKKKFGEMQSRMQEHVNDQTNFTGQPGTAQKEPLKKQKEDYIDFEEIKWVFTGAGKNIEKFQLPFLFPQPGADWQCLIDEICKLKFQ